MLFWLQRKMICLPKIFDEIYTIVISDVVMFEFESISCYFYAYYIEKRMCEVWYTECEG
jgi:hypothetical protein